MEYVSLDRLLFEEKNDLKYRIFVKSSGFECLDGFSCCLDYEREKNMSEYLRNLEIVMKEKN